MVDPSVALGRRPRWIRPTQVLVAVLASIVLAFRAIRRGDAVRHRRWMIRAFAIGIGIGTIRLWIGFFMGAGLMSLHDSFAIAFWLSFTMHAAAGEAWLRAAALPPEVRPAEAPRQDRAATAREELG